MRAANKAGTVDATVVSRTNHSCLHGLIAEMITGRISPGVVASPARLIFCPGPHARGRELGMFGIRTVLIARDLLGADQAVRERALRAAPLIHASDTVAAALAAARGKLPRRTGVLITAISAANTVLALAARHSG